jgi:hypothetical protein
LTQALLNAAQGDEGGGGDDLADSAQNSSTTGLAKREASSGRVGRVTNMREVNNLGENTKITLDLMEGGP